MDWIWEIKRRKEADSQVLALLTEQIVVPFMKLDNMRRDKFSGKDGDYALMH